ncbi:MAG: HAD hydrolase family protein [Eubacterium sp.]
MHYKFPKIGMRIIKTAIAVFICLVISSFKPQSVPLYSAITAILCMQPYLSNSKTVAINRVIGTCVGGLFGMIVLLFNQHFVPIMLVQYFIVALCIIPLIYTTIVINHSAASAFTCIVFLSTTVIPYPDVAAQIVALNRVIDTLIGILVALAINGFHFPAYKNRSTLFVCELDHTLAHSDGSISGYAEFELNKMIEDGAWIAIVTDRTPATLVPMVENINLNLPTIAMNGAVLYDVKDQSYSFSTPMKREVSDAVEDLFARNNYNCFVHAIINETMHIYYGDFKNVPEERFYHDKRKTPHKNYIFGKLPKDQYAISIIGIHETRRITVLKKELEKLPFYKQLSVVVYPYKKQNGYSIIEIYGAQATRRNAIEKLKKDLSVDRVVAFGSTTLDIPTFKWVDRSYAVENAIPQLKMIASQTIGSSDDDAVIKAMEHLFYSKKKV